MGSRFCTWAQHIGWAVTFTITTIMLYCGGCSQRHGSSLINAGQAEEIRSANITPCAETPTHMSEAILRDKIYGAWLGQMIGVTWGFPTEFYARYIWEMFPDLHSVDGRPQNIYAAYEGGPIPLEKLPTWKPEMINGAYTQDDLYVEVVFMEALREHGVNAGWKPLGDAFAGSTFPLWHANAMARKNLQSGISAPESGHYCNGGESDDIDWQIECDFVGLANPGQPHSAAEMAFRVGHVMNNGDGVYGGVFVSTMIASAFTADSVRAIAETGREAVPQGSLYRCMLDQAFASCDRGDSFDTNLAAINSRWGTTDRCVEWGGDEDSLNIDAKMNGTYILLGLLYGEGDMVQSMRYAMACGQDSDCNPSNVGSILGAFYGRKAIAAMDENWLGGLDTSLVFKTTPYNLDELVEMNLELARAVVAFKGGRAPAGGTWQLPAKHVPDRLLLEQWPTTPNARPSLHATVDLNGRIVHAKAEADDDDGILGYQWFFGDLAFSSGPEHNHTYRQPGHYEIVAYVADKTGNTAYEIIPIDVP